MVSSHNTAMTSTEKVNSELKQNPVGLIIDLETEL